MSSLQREPLISLFIQRFPKSSDRLFTFMSKFYMRRNKVQRRHKIIGELSRLNYLHIFFFYCLPVWIWLGTFAFMATSRHGMDMESLNLVFGFVAAGVLWFFLGAALSFWSLKSDSKTVSAVKIILAVLALILVNFAVKTVVGLHQETLVPIVTEWLPYLTVQDDVPPLIATPSASTATLLALGFILYLVFFYRYFCYRQKNGRLLAAAVALGAAACLCRYLEIIVFYGGPLGFGTSGIVAFFDVTNVYIIFAVSAALHAVLSGEKAFGADGYLKYESNGQNP